LAEAYEALLESIEARVPHVGPGELGDVTDPLLVDVRRPEEYAEEHIPGAISLPRDKLEARIEEHMTNADQTVVVYCGGRGRSTLAGWALTEMGLDARILRGGLTAWRS